MKAEKEKKIQKVIDLLEKRTPILEIASATGIPAYQVVGIKGFYGFVSRRGFNILETWKKTASGNNQFIFSGSFILRELDLDPTEKYEFKAVGVNKKTKTFEIKIREAE